eukprot:8683473-Alexandrium_andersonii.AAC.1
MLAAWNIARSLGDTARAWASPSAREPGGLPWANSPPVPPLAPGGGGRRCPKVREVPLETSQTRGPVPLWQ